MNKLPPELHIVHGTKGKNQGVALPEKIKMRIPKAYWLSDSESWNEDKFIEETADYLFKVYGIGSEQDQHILAMLANQISIYIKCLHGINETGIITEYNNGKTLGPSPYISLMDKILQRIVTLMNELGLTPRGRLQKVSTDTQVDLGDLMAGPANYK
tara:strand:+ start:36 stop:506 length:471 start_codon:yes stop_codon:yes gene_type:complete